MEEPRIILTDYLRTNMDLSWKYAAQMGIRHAVVRVPEEGFELTSSSDWKSLKELYGKNGFVPCVVEPVPEDIYRHIKEGDADRDRSIDRFIQMIAILDKLNIRIICANFMAFIGWFRTGSRPRERGGAIVTEFVHEDCRDAFPIRISEEELWNNLRYFIEAVAPELEKHQVKLAFHPDDPPLRQIKDVRRILISKENIDKMLQLHPSPMVGLTLCQGCFGAMGESIAEMIYHYGKQNKIFFVHFRDIRGNKEAFCETFHDNGQTDMAEVIRAYKKIGYSGPIRVDHVPTMAGEADGRPGYGTLGRLYAVGYLKGLLDASNYRYI